MKKLTFFTLSLLMISITLLPIVFGSGPSPPLRALPEGAKMRISYGGDRQVVYRGDRQVEPNFVFSPDGTRLAVVSPIIGIWIHDAHTGDELALLTGHTDSITSVMFSPDGKTIASGSLDKTVRLWDAHTFEHRATLTGHLGNTNVLAFSPDSKKLATGASGKVPSERRGSGGLATRWSDLVESQPKISTDGTVQIWDVITGKSIKTIPVTDTGWITRLVYAPDNITLISSSTDGTYRSWNTETGEGKRIDLKDTYRSLHLSPNGTRFVSKDQNKTVLWDAATRKELAILESDLNQTSTYESFSQNSEILICRLENSPEIQIWDTRTGRQRTTILTDTDGRFFPTALSADGRILAAQENQEKGSIQLWETIRGNKVATLAINANVNTLRFSPDGQTFAMMSSRLDKDPRDYGQVILLWNISTGKETGTIPYRSNFGQAYQPAFVASNGDGMLACGIGDARIWLFDGNTGKYRASLKGHSAAINDIAFSTDGKMIASASKDGTVRLWSTKTNLHLETLKEQPDSADGVSPVNAVVFSYDGLTLASVNSFRYTNIRGIQLWNIKTKKYDSILKDHPYGVSAFAFSPDGETLATSGSKGNATIDLWDTRTKKLKTTYIGHTSRVTALAFSPDGTLLASGGGERDSTVQLWDTATGENSLMPKESSWGDVNALAFSPDGTLLASTSGYQIEVWDVGFRQHKATLKGHSRRITSLAFTGDGNMLASAGYDQTVVLWKPIPIVDENVIAKITPSSVASPTIGKHLTFNIEIEGGENVAGYHITVQYDASALRYISSNKGDYLSEDAFFAKPIVEKNQVTLVSTAITGVGNGNGTLATVTYEVVTDKPLPLNIANLILSDKEGKRLRATVNSSETTKK